MKEALIILQIIVSVFLISSILLQAKGTGLGSAWGGQGAAYQTRRGVEKFLFMVSIGLAVLFFIIQIAILSF